MKQIILHNQWSINAPIEKIFNIVTDFEKSPEYFSKVVESINIIKRENNFLEIEPINLYGYIKIY